ncbi:hypothetical protein NM208_g7250 [Fusarium decemcellulare]|uniref:Uncharacterized protein n=1 Tax=Fusarium decemcellulare TaxID=57161 RepID=A0ACC1S9X5_9HYPO|nr:hypothetical protein NM208_g7250 [Fusarium decemcellulare]
MSAQTKSDGTCSRNETIPAVLPQGEDRDRFLYPRGNAPTSTDQVSVLTPEPTSTYAMESSDAFVDHLRSDSRDSIGPPVVAGIFGAALLLTLVLLVVYWKRRHRPLAKQSQNHDSVYASIPTQSSSQDAQPKSDVPAANPGTDLQTNWHSGPKRLQSPTAAAVLPWMWDVILTLIPISLGIVAIRLDGRSRSDYGERVMELTRLSPTLYPILFAAIASRFYENLARWCLERPGGISLVTLEHLFGSQSFAQVLGRVFIIRTQVTVGVTILLTWAMSPLGGQSASRILSYGHRESTTSTNIYYADPGQQTSHYLDWLSSKDSGASVTALYSASLLSSGMQKRSPRDLWDLPRIPQWPGTTPVGEWYDVDVGALAAGLAAGSSHYVSLLGVRVEGLEATDGETTYDFSIETSYTNFTCFVGFNSDPAYDAPAAKPEQWIAAGRAEPFRVNITSSIPWDEWTKRENPPPLGMLYRSLSIEDDGYSFNIATCSIRTIFLETAMSCGPAPLASTCAAVRQRRVEDRYTPNRVSNLLRKSPTALQEAVYLWPKASGEGVLNQASPTENYILGDPNPYAGQPTTAWGDKIDDQFPEPFSRRFTTAFNTFWDATIDPLGHTNVSFMATAPTSEGPVMNVTVGAKTVTREVYTANRLWISLLLATTILLEILAILGLLLQFRIHGPDILGFASSITRDNPYVPLPPGGSHLDGSDRTRLLQHVRLQLADVHPKGEKGYITVRAVPSSTHFREVGSEPEGESGGTWRPLDQKRLYD